MGCVSYDPDHETYFGRLGRKQRHPEFRSRRSAMRYAVRGVAMLGMVVLSYRVSKTAAALLVPYILWVTIAPALNYFVWVLNA